MAATIGLGKAAMRSTTSGSCGMTGGLPNSVMSAPAKKVRPSHASTTALIDASPSASSKAAVTPVRTAAPSAFTGGLSEMMTRTSPWRSVVMTDIGAPWD